jgi:hypothetical protein
MASLKSRFEQFMSILPSIEMIDDLLPDGKHGERIADYFGLGRKIIFEQKAITTDQADKIQREIDKYQDEDFFPLFYGKRDINEILKHFPDQYLVRQKIYNLITRVLEEYLSSANKQIPSTEALFGLQNTVGVLIILNDSIRVLSPEIIAHRINSRLLEKINSGEFRFNRVNYVVLISETHNFKGKMPLILTIEGPSISENKDIVSEYLQYLSVSWAHYNGGELAQLSVEEINWQDFKEAQKKIDLPKTRSQERTEWYGYNPYLSPLTDEQLLEYGSKLIEAILPYVLKGGIQAPIQRVGEMFLQFGDFIEETNHRGVDLKEMKEHLKQVQSRFSNAT